MIMKKYVNIHNESSICSSCEKFITPLNLTLWKTFCITLVLLSTEKKDFCGSFPASLKKTLLYNSSCSVSEDKATDGIGNVIMAGPPQRCVWAANLLAPGHCCWDTSLCALRLFCLCSLPPCLPCPGPCPVCTGLTYMLFFLTVLSQALESVLFLAL